MFAFFLSKKTLRDVFVKNAILSVKNVCMYFKDISMNNKKRATIIWKLYRTFKLKINNLKTGFWNFKRKSAISWAANKNKTYRIH